MELILVDTSIWVDHIRRSVPELVGLVRDGRCVLHPYVLMEIALGSLQDRDRRIGQLRTLPSVEPVGNDTLLDEMERLGLPGSGLGFVDAHLLAAAAARTRLKIWSRDRRLADRAEAIGLGWSPDADGAA